MAVNLSSYTRHSGSRIDQFLEAMRERGEVMGATEPQIDAAARRVQRRLLDDPDIMAFDHIGSAVRIFDDELDHILGAARDAARRKRGRIKWRPVRRWN
jgi:hypothetical protein